jgi:hypothetical protein
MLVVLLWTPAAAAAEYAVFGMAWVLGFPHGTATWHRRPGRGQALMLVGKKI